MNIYYYNGYIIKIDQDFHYSKEKPLFCNPFALLKVGKYYMKNSEFDLCKTYLDASLLIDKKNPFTLNTIGNYYLEINDFKLAKKYYKKSLKNNCNYYIGLYNLGLVNMKKETWKADIKAIDYFLEYMRKYNNTPNTFIHGYVYINIAICYLNIKQFTLCLEYANIAQKYNSKENSFTFYIIGKCYEQMNHHINAKKYYKKGFILSSPKSAYNLALIYENESKFEKAIKVLKLIETNNEPFVHSVNCTIAEIYVNIDIDTAITLFKQNHAKYKCSGSLYMLGCIYFKKKEFNMALEYFLQALPLSELFEEQKKCILEYISSCQKN